MGSWFSNIHIRKSELTAEETIVKYLCQWMTAQQFLPATSVVDADGAVAIVASVECPWVSVYSDLLSLEDPLMHTQIAAELSAGLGTDVLGISCFDSDYLYLNLINSGDNTDAWLGIGSAAGLGIKRRSGLNSWKQKVSDFSVFLESAKKRYVLAEEFLSEAERCLSLPVSQSLASYEYLSDFELDQKAQYFYFKLPEDRKNKEPVKLIPFLSSGMPCFLEKCSAVGAVNMGAESRGLSVFFVGPYVEHDEITFSDVQIAKLKKGGSESTPIELAKVQLTDGQWAYYYHDPGFRIPPKVDDRLPMGKRMQKESENSVIVRFVPHGNPRKILDITVALVPDKNPEGLTEWNVWAGWESKKEYMDHFNESWAESRKLWPDACPPLLKEEDFD